MERWANKLPQTSIAPKETAKKKVALDNHPKNDYKLVEKPKSQKRIYNLNQHLKTAQETREAERNIIKKKESFTIESLQEEWKNAMINFVETQINAEVLINSLKDIQLSIVRENIIGFKLPSKVLIKEFQNKKQNLLLDIQKRLSNDFIEFEVTLDNTVIKTEKYNSFQTPEDIYKKMVQENPTLEHLRKKLGMHIEY